MGWGGQGVHWREECWIIRFCFFLWELGAESEQKSHQVVCYRAGNETRGLDMEWRER